MSRVRSAAAAGVVAALVGVMAPGATVVASAEAAPEAVRFTNHTAQRTVSANSTAELRVACPAGTSVVGGGVDVEGGNTFTWVHASYPYDGPDGDTRPDDGWAGAIANGTPNNRRMSTYAVCAASGSFTYVQANGSVSANSSTFGIEARCAASARVIGGGIRIMRSTSPPVVSVLGSYPLAAVGEPRIGWAARVQHRGSTPASVAVRVFAICETGPAAQQVNYQRSLFDVDGGPAAGALATASCATGFVAVGGGVVMSPPTGVLRARSIHSTTPADGQDAGVAPGDAWGVRVSSPDTTIAVAVAVCSK